MRLSVHLMVRDGATVLDRLLRPLRGIADEICYVDTGSTDGTPDLLGKLAGELGIACRGVAFSPMSRPDMYFADAPESFRRLVPGEHTGRHLLRDWSSARNAGLAMCRGDYVMKLDADDEVVDPGNVLPTLVHLDACPQIDLVCCTYEVMDPSTGLSDRVEMYTRLWRNRPEIFFREICHENVDWCRRSVDGVPNWTLVPSGLHFRDHRDSRAVRVPYRNLKVLLREYERLEAVGGLPTAHLVTYLAHEACQIRPDLALELLEWLDRRAQSPGDEAWVRMIRGAALEAIGDLDRALIAYEGAASRGSPRGALLRALVLQKISTSGWREVLASAVELNQGRCYPAGASLSELRGAERLLGRLP